MEQERTRLVEEENTIYEIDLNCMRRKQMQRKRKEERQERQQKGSRCQKRP